MKSSRPSSGEKVFKRQDWVIDSPAAQAWVNSLIWITLQKTDRVINLSTAGMSLADAPSLLIHTLVHNHLQGIALDTFGDGLRIVLGESFYKMVETDRRRTEILLQELEWLITPKLGGEFMVIWDATMRQYYGESSRGLTCPRVLRNLTLWIPTLDIRVEMMEILKDAGYIQVAEDEGYLFRKNTLGIDHFIYLRGVLWETTKNWNTEFERDMWDRAKIHPRGKYLIPDVTDSFVLGLRHYSIDTLFGSAIHLLDLAVMLENVGSEHLDWSHIFNFTKIFKKPFWVWSSFLALEILEKRTGRKFYVPDWLREELMPYRNSFWNPFIESRMNWSSPDIRLADYSRVYVKLSEGK